MILHFIVVQMLLHLLHDAAENLLELLCDDVSGGVTYHLLNVLFSEYL